MSSKKSSRRQQWRQQKITQDKEARHAKQAQKSEQLINTSELGPQRKGRIVANYGANFEILDQNQHTHHCLSRKNLPKLVCGDWINWCMAGEDIGVIVELLPRQTLLARPAYNKQLKPVAANVDQIIVVVAPVPSYDMDLINRYLIAARLTQITPIIVVNKIDLLSELEQQQLQSELQLYPDIGYPLCFISNKLNSGLQPLWQILNHKTSIFAGQSGVGKSSLIQTLLPDNDIRVGELSLAKGLGKHTTSVTRLYPLRSDDIVDGAIIDSPGIREFGLGHVSQERIALGFVEFNSFLGQCKFNNCSHHHEPGCAITAAVSDGKISQNRYDSYSRIVQSLSRR